MSPQDHSWGQPSQQPSGQFYGQYGQLSSRPPQPSQPPQFPQSYTPLQAQQIPHQPQPSQPQSAYQPAPTPYQSSQFLQPLPQQASQFPQQVPPQPSQPPQSQIPHLPHQPSYNHPGSQYPQQHPQQPQPHPYNYQAPKLPGSAPKAQKGKKRFLAAIAAVTVFVALAGAGAYAFVSSRVTPDSVFADAIESSLSTQSVKQTQVIEGGKLQVYYDFSRPADPRVATESQLDTFGIAYDTKQYASLQDSYVLYNKFPSLFTADADVEKFKGKWMQERTDGKEPTVSFWSIGSIVPDAYIHLFGDWIFGNFSKTDRQSIQELILQEKVYSYNASQVTKKQLDGKDVYAYTVTIDRKKQKETIKKVAAIWGVDGDKVLKDSVLVDDDALAEKLPPFTLYIDIHTKRLVQVEGKPLDTVVTNKYEDYNSTAMPAEPKIQADYGDFLRATGERQTGTN